ncbi:hypothetical protein [Citreimonas salinaria]|uniref:Uncharacterized protein n=1 Tax=Citreimonas salinaria TaxID=321339 RepID=A0A1H3GER9_9RHOB|nr:hypothetical protein [Citreimonas salinaria]SDY01852.1 hypothetical protein SAMN05444340_102313 [Citreimonas salinaria]
MTARPLARLLLALLTAAAPVVAQDDPTGAPAGEPVVADGVTVPHVDSAPLGAQGVGAAGLLPPSVTGLPNTLWEGSDASRLARLIAETDPAVPALRALMRTLMLAEAAPPSPDSGVAHLGARLDWLFEAGAVDEALAVLEIVGTNEPQLFARWADLTLLLGRIEAPCRTLAARPALSDDLGLRVFCIARGGDWSRAALILGSAGQIGALPARRVDLLERYLDPEIHEARGPLQPPVRPTPLEFRLFESVGEPLPTAPLPLPFAVLDLTGDMGWRAQIVAAERLARVGALPANRLLGVYTARQPAASGGVWDRVAAFQALEGALASDVPGAVGPALEKAWPQMASAGLLVPFSTLFARQLADLPLEGRAARMAERAALLSPDYRGLAGDLAAGDDATAFLRAIAGVAPEDYDLAEAPVPDLPHAAAVAAAFAPGALPPDGLADALVETSLGETLLRAIGLFSDGMAGNPHSLTEALATLRAVGLEDTARQAALQAMLLDAERARR